MEPTVQQNGSPGAALVVNGWSLEQTLKEDSQYNADGIIGALRGNGYDPDYLGPQAYFNPESIREWIADQSLELGPGQTATIYITGHGANRDGSGLISVGGYLLFEEDLAYWLSMFDPGVNVVVILDACYSGSFIDGLSEVADMVITSTDAEHISAGDYDPLETPDSEKNDPNPKDLEPNSPVALLKIIMKSGRTRQGWRRCRRLPMGTTSALHRRYGVSHGTAPVRKMLHTSEV